MLLGLVAEFAVIAVAALHFVFFVLETFFWTKPLGRRIFGLTSEVAQNSASLAINQGVYNGFVSAGLVWGHFAHECAFNIKVFFLGFVVIAGVVGGLTAKRSILAVQAAPGLLALLLVLFTQR